MLSVSTDQEKFVSIVIPCFNGLGTIGDCLRSLEQQKYRRDRFEIIVVDNGSLDGTCDYVRSSFPLVKLVHSSQKGSGYARNAGISNASGELILSTDSDCVADENWISSLVQAFETAPHNVAAVGGSIRPFSQKTGVERYKGSWVGQPGMTKTDSGIRYTATPNAAFRTTDIRSVDAFDGTLGFDDTDLGIRLIQAGFKIEFSNSAIVYHRNPSTIAELYKHKLKYGKFSFDLAKKHPHLLGNPQAPFAVTKLFLETVRRLVGDICIKLPIALLLGAKDLPRIWPWIDAVIAVGNYQGFARAAAANRRELKRSK